MMHDGEIWRRIRTGALRPAERRNGTEGISIHHGDLALSRGLRLTLRSEPTLAPDSQLAPRL